MNSVVTQSDALPEATSISLNLPESMTFEQWEDVGAELANRAKKLNWWIGDWWAAGHHRYGERARLAARGLFGREFKTLANIASVCRAFEPDRRREHLSWSHHAEAAALSPGAADMLLDLAERDRMSKAQVRAAVTTIRGGGAARPTSAEAASVYRAYNRLPQDLRLAVARALAAAAQTGAEIDPQTGELRREDASQAPAREAAAPVVGASEAILNFEELAGEIVPEEAAPPREVASAQIFDLHAAKQPASREDAEPADTASEDESPPPDDADAWLRR